MVHHSKFFYGHEISDYGLQNRYIDYRTLSRAFDMVLNNDIMEKTVDIGYWEMVSGLDEDWVHDEDEDEYVDDYFPEIFQTYIVSEQGAEILIEAGMIVYYNEVLDMYVWGITHWGTSWDYVLTNIKIEIE